MRHLMSLLVVLAVASFGFAGPTPREVLERAIEVTEDMEKLKMKGIPAKLLADAQGVAIVPRVIKAGFIVSGGFGHGVVFTRGEKGEWGDPTFVTMAGAGVGFQAGVQSTDVILVFSKKESLERVLGGKGKLTLGADASVAAGPLGRQATAATDIKLQAEVLSYSRSRGLFAGVSFTGARLTNDKDNNDAFPRDTRTETTKALGQLKVNLHQLAKEPAVQPQPIPVIKP
jgi:lipid-binding SYLF domain-containing protein